MSDLTEQRKKGKLPSGWYYIEIFDFLKNKVVDIDFWRGLTWQENHEDSVLQIIAPVLSYEEYRNLTQHNQQLKHDVGNLGYKIKNQRKEIENRLREIEKFKDLLKDCRDVMQQDILSAEEYKLLQKIDEALK